MTSPISTLWRTYSAERSPAIRNAIAEHYIPTVEHLAANLARKIPAHSISGYDDLVSSGVVGLLGAIERYDGRGKFEPFASLRIQGEMLDALRADDSRPRLARTTFTDAEKARATHYTRTGEKLEDAEAASRLGMSTSRFLENTNDPQVLSLDHKHPEGDECLPEGMPEPPDQFAAVHSRDAIRAMLQGLSREDRLLILLYYESCCTMGEIGKVLGLSESRVSQLHSKVLGILRSRLNVPNPITAKAT